MTPFLGNRIRERSTTYVTYLQVVQKRICVCVFMCVEKDKKKSRSTKIQ